MPSLMNIFNVAGSAMSAESQRLNVTASNLANADSTTGPDGQPYRAKQVVFAVNPLGGAIALQYALDAIEDDTLTRPTRVILISPMIGVTRFARFAGFAGLPSVLPAFAKAAWLGIVPEFNPF